MREPAQLNIALRDSNLHTQQSVLATCARLRVILFQKCVQIAIDHPSDLPQRQFSQGDQIPGRKNERARCAGRRDKYPRVPCASAVPAV